ncbi:ABC transporter ATP-binding protein [Terrisporobacter glycolicus]|uniref:Petrobactin import ATP-binding protein FpuC n=1 Tax=Terrisporobacter glycolicus ATCC 14880 = DSM 1288 TaxID=1121315 RepID=A0ABZ2EVC2_9FIRM|nr:ABC transporter ATP-binding protein [Terrisporobacter glycolicus]
MLRGENISFSYNKDKAFIENLNINIPKGKITTILGPNGSGKSTLLSILSTYNKASKGNVYLEDKNLKNLKTKEIARLIATVHQHNESPTDLDVEALVSYGRVPHNKHCKDKNEDEKIIDWAIKSTNLEDIKDNKVMSLSGGQRQRAFIAMALAQKTDVLLLDEPTTYLDIYHQIEILELVKKLNEDHKITIIMVLHDINQAIKYSDNIVIMKDGKIIEEGNPQKVINENTIKSVYNVEGVICNIDKEEMYFVPTKAC